MILNFDANERLTFTSPIHRRSLLKFVIAAEISRKHTFRLARAGILCI